MASGITHILLAKNTPNKLPEGKLKSILALTMDSFKVGSIAPDLPYASIVGEKLFSNQSELADLFHYEQSNQIALSALKMLKELNGRIDMEQHYHMFAFFLGYISHIIGDGVMHPFVRDKVGDYAQNKSEHRSFEMKLDILFLEEQTKGSGLRVEANYTDVYNQIKDSFKLRDVILTMFSELIEIVYNKHCSAEMINAWIKSFHHLFDFSEGEHPCFYWDKKSNSVFYRNMNHVERSEIVHLCQAKDRESNFLYVDKVDFFKDCIPRFYDCFKVLAQKAYLYVYEEGEELSDDDLPCIDLDTGRLVDNNDLKEIPVFWRSLGKH